ncbi:MAG: hypothetical protein WBA07_33650 [Rivularia sp. (in: cyanobacteria)]
MSEFQNIKAKKAFSGCLSLIIFTDVSDAELEDQLNRAKCIDEQRKLLLNSDVSIEDYLDAVEYYGVDIDRYVQEVEQNLILGLNDLHR